jgi:tRNA(Ile)-lysidine synthase
MPTGMSPSVLSKVTVEGLLADAGRRPRVLVAFSGGLDSTALAHMLMKQRRRLGGLRLVHVDHGLQSASAEWARLCVKQARDWRVPIEVRRVKVAVKRGESLEAAAREVRYAQFAAVMQSGEVLLTAQHQDDQAETFLLQLFRGAGVTGLAAMPRKMRFGSGWLVRPLLSASRAEIEVYARHHRLTWTEDPTNQSERFARNFLRHRVLPLMRERWPGVDGQIARAAGHMAEAGKLLESIATRDLMTAADGDGLNVAALRRLTPARRRNVLRAFIAKAGLELPSTAQMMEIAGSLLVARPDAQPEVDWWGCVIRRRAGRLELQVKSEKSPELQLEIALKSWHWRDHREFILNGAGDRLTLIDDPQGAIDLDKLPRWIDLRPRAGGESLRPGPRARTQSLKKLLQAARLTVEQRARLPLLFTGVDPKGRAKPRLIAAGDRWIDVSIAANVKSPRRARLVWTRNS